MNPAMVECMLDASRCLGTIGDGDHDRHRLFGLGLPVQAILDLGIIVYMVEARFVGLYVGLLHRGLRCARF